MILEGRNIHKSFGQVEVLKGVDISVETGEVIEFTSDEIERLQHEIAEKHGFELIDHSLVLYVKRDGASDEE